ncbi:MAG: histidinol-phosphatase [Solirubrobacterales bacterium]
MTLTDYHTHLRPDVGDTPPERYFTEANVHRYLEVAAERGVTELGFSEHVYRFREALDVWRHPFWRECAHDSLDDYVEFVSGMDGVKLGLEVDWIPGREAELIRLIDGRPWDYIIGSVHFVADRAVDHDGYDIWESADSDEIWSSYFGALGEAAASGLFDVLAHPDLVKVWGRGRPDPPRPRRAYYEIAMPAIAAADVAIEVSTAGLRKPVGEIYPARELLEMCVEAGKPVALSSDAHEPQHVGHGYEAAVALLREVGVERVSVFDRRVRAEEPLG